MFKVIDITTKNLRIAFAIEPWQVRVDRGTILGNPFKLTSENEREEVCLKYRAYFYDKLKTDAKFKTEVDKLEAIYKQYGKLELFCWCAPKACHADVIQWYLVKKLNDEREANENGTCKKD